MQKPGLFGMNGFMVFLLTCFSFAAHAQAGYLVLIDAENNQPFTVRVGDELYASTGHGHIVLSNLKDSSYKLNLQFPKKNVPEQVFPVKISEKDIGFELKGSDSSSVLYNWQTKETIRPVAEKDSSRILDRGIKREDGFSKLMAAVVNDTSVMYNTYIGQGFSQDSSTFVARTPTPDHHAPAVALNIKSSKLKPPLQVPKDSVATSVALVAQDGPHSLAAAASSTLHHSLSTVKKVREVSLKISRKMVFLDIGKDGQKDTVTLFVYFENEEAAQSVIAPVPALKKPLKTDTIVVVAKDKLALKPAEPICSQLATDEDMEAVRSAILKANAEQDKILVASGAFAMKCFSVSQVRVLAGLFVSDKAKYHLMDAAHMHLADHDHFSELADMYTDKNFQRKFLVMATRRS